MGGTEVLKLSEGSRLVDADSRVTERHDLCTERAPKGFAAEWPDKLEKPRPEYFRDTWCATSWFETGRGDLQHPVDAVGEDKVLFETDVPHLHRLSPAGA
jgi:hypothetical protein